MASTVSDAFRIYLGWKTPSTAEREAAAKHRESIETALRNGIGLKRFVQIGSFSHGTGVSIWSDVDYLASLPGERPAFSDSALRSVRSVLSARYPSTVVKIRRPAVVVEFAGGEETYEVVPAYLKRGTGGDRVYAIPGRVAEWIETAPDAHRGFVNSKNASPSGGAKGLARLLKCWKYARSVSISSFYLEMRAAAYMADETSIVWSIDMRNILGRLAEHELAAMNDPTGHTGRIHACTEDQRPDAISKLNTACSRARRARLAEGEGRIADAFATWDLVFAGGFPGYY
jgi:hypothetical protein